MQANLCICTSNCSSATMVQRCMPLLPQACDRGVISYSLNRSFWRSPPCTDSIVSRIAPTRSWVWIPRGAVFGGGYLGRGEYKGSSCSRATFDTLYVPCADSNIAWISWSHFWRWISLFLASSKSRFFCRWVSLSHYWRWISMGSKSRFWR